MNAFYFTLVIVMAVVVVVIEITLNIQVEALIESHMIVTVRVQLLLNIHEIRFSRLDCWAYIVTFNFTGRTTAWPFISLKILELLFYCP